MRIPRCAAALLVGLATGCAHAPHSIARFGPTADLLGNDSRSTPLIVDLHRPAYVVALNISYPATPTSNRPVIVQARYPRRDTDEKHFGPGRHRLTSRSRFAQEPLNCRDNEIPRLDGCRRPLHLLPGASDWAGQSLTSDPVRHALLIIVSHAFIDPYPLAEHLYYELLRDWQRAGRLRDADAEGLAEELRPLLRDRLGERGWSGHLEIVF